MKQKIALTAIIIIGTFLLAQFVFAAATSPGDNTGNPLIRIGEYPPDFDLPRLTLTKDDAGKPVGVIDPNDRVRLSQFRGKRPVLLVMSSYT